jgi:hypothetical protein
MAKEQVDERFVAFFDMLGMSDLSLRDADIAWGALSDLSKAKNEILKIGIEIVNTSEIIEDRVRAFTFSDSIVAFTLSNQVVDTYAIVILSSELFSAALHSCIPLRGAIAHGRFLFNFDQNLFAGPPLVNAYRLSEEAQWLGIRLDEVVASKARDIPLQSKQGNQIIIDWEVPTKSGEKMKSHVIDWVTPHINNFTVQPPVSVQQFYQAFQSMFGCFEQLPESVQRKYTNTVEFINNRLVTL